MIDEGLSEQMTRECWEGAPGGEELGSLGCREQRSQAPGWEGRGTVDKEAGAEGPGAPRQFAEDGVHFQPVAGACLMPPSLTSRSAW